MAAGFTLVASEDVVGYSATTRDTTLSFTPAVGDIIQVFLRDTNNTPEIASAGATYTKLTSTPWRADTHSAAVFRCTGAGSADNLTVSVDFGDAFAGHLVQIVRPVDLDYVGKVGQNENDSTASLTVSLTTSSPAALLGFGSAESAGGFTSDSGWTTLDEVGSVLEGMCEYRLSDDTEFVVDPANTVGVFGSAFEFSAVDATAPTLSSPSGTATGETTADLSVSTDEDNGTLYWVVTESATAPSVAQIQAGQDNSGAAAAASGNQAVSATGTQNASATGLAAGTTYTAHFQHQDAATNDSAVVSSATFTTDAAGSASLLDSSLLKSTLTHSRLVR